MLIQLNGYKLISKLLLQVTYVYLLTQKAFVFGENQIKLIEIFM